MSVGLFNWVQIRVVIVMMEFCIVRMLNIIKQVSFWLLVRVGNFWFGLELLKLLGIVKLVVKVMVVIRVVIIRRVLMQFLFLLLVGGFVCFVIFFLNISYVDCFVDV